MNRPDTDARPPTAATVHRDPISGTPVVTFRSDDNPDVVWMHYLSDDDDAVRLAHELYALGGQPAEPAAVAAPPSSPARTRRAAGRRRAALIAGARSRGAR